jgi:hypothetical protein
MASTWGTNTWGSNEWQDDVITVSLTAPESASALGTPQSFNVEGWGRQAYGNSGWGVEYSVKPSGVSATTSLGTAEASQIITVEPTGLEANSNLGSISINSEVTLSGQSTTVSLGTTESFNETGWGRLTWNTADWGEGADETISVSGLEATASPGSITTKITVLLEMVGANHSMTTSVGSPDIDAELGVPVTGVESTFATPTLSYTGTLVGWGRDEWGDLSWGESPNQVIPLVGQDATASVGSILPADVIGLSGQEAETSVGSTTIKLDSTPAITGQEATASPGVLGLEFGPASISGVSATFNVGTLGLEFGPAEITGVEATSSVGSLEIGSVELVNVSGVSASTAVGSLTIGFAYELSGQSSTTAVGSITPANVVGLTGQQATFSQGEGGVQAYANINTGSNSSFSNIDTGSNTSYSDTSTGSNSSYSDQSTGSNSSYSNVATGSNTSYSDAA